jgi:hypothetical protein
MAKPKTKDWKVQAFSLDKDTCEKLSEIASYEGLNKSEMIDYLIKNWDSGTNPNEKLKSLQKEKKILQEKTSKIDDEIDKTIKQITLFEDWKKVKNNRKQQAINIIERKIINNQIEEAEIIARTWQRMTGIQAMELLIEAKENIERKGI